MGETSTNNRVKLEPEQAVTLTIDSHTACGTFQQSRTDQWWISIAEQDVTLLKGKQYIRISFNRGETTYSAPAEIILIQEETTTLILQEPPRFDCHPIRKTPRVATHLEASLIIQGKDDTPDQYVYRTENRVLNISLGGMQLACASPLPKHTTDILVLLGLNPNDPTARESQIYCHGILSRTANEIADPEFPYVYGICFKPLAPMFAKMLGEFIEHEG